MDARQIRILPESVVQKIAAGEVIERPASVVKELLENSLDAGARRIEIRIAEGGKSLIAVSDDGSGIPPEEALLALQRHATSKIESDEDLFKIGTYGFRGEALASISAISQFDLLTRHTSRTEGVRVRSEGGEIRSVEPAGTPPGTTIAVANLFYNVPARRKFLRGNATELGHIDQIVRRISLGQPGVEFFMESEGEVELHLPATSDLQDRIRQLYGAEVSQKLVPIEGEVGPMALKGFVSLPQVTFSRAQEIFVYINGRPVRDRTLQAAIMEGYRSALMERRYPLAVLWLSIPPHLVDVNVHPAKTEVRFADTQTPYRLVARAIADAMGKSAPTAAFGHTLPFSEPMQTEIPSTPYLTPELLMTGVARTEPAEYVTPATPRESKFGSLRHLGTLDQTYLLFSGPDSLYVIDQHAAHERVLYENLKRSFERKSPERQGLLIPLTLELSSEKEAMLSSRAEFLSALGFELESFGPNTWIIKAIPSVLGNHDPRPLLTDLASSPSPEEGAEDWKNYVDATLARIACHSAVRAHDRMLDREIEFLLNEMDSIDLSTNCPHGRPTFLRFTLPDFERLFHRR